MTFEAKVMNREFRMLARSAILAVMIQGWGGATSMATIIPVIESRSIQGGGNLVQPSIPFAPFNVSLSGVSGSASQASVINGSLDGFSGAMQASSGGCLTADYYSTFDFAFTLEEAHSFSAAVDIATSAYGASTWYILVLNGAFDLSAFDQGLDFSMSGVLGPGDYHFFLMNNAFHSNREYPVSSDIATEFSFSVTPVAAVPDNSDSTLVLTAFGIAIVVAVARPVRGVRQ